MMWSCQKKKGLAAAGEGIEFMLKEAINGYLFQPCNAVKMSEARSYFHYLSPRFT